MKIIYLHGYGSTGQSGTADYLRKRVKDAKVISPDIPVDPEEAMPYLRQLCIKECPDIIIGTSMGGFYAHQLRNYAVCICVNPALHLSKLTEVLKVGTFEFFQPRKDGQMSYTITQNIIQHFVNLENHQFDDIHDSEYVNNRVYGLFGTEDNVVTSKEEFAMYYDHIDMFEGGHRMNNRIIREVIVPLVNKLKNDCVKGIKPLGGFFMTAEKANHMDLWNVWHYYVNTDKGRVECECGIPDVEKAKEYIEARTIRENVLGGTPYMLSRKYTSDEVDQYCKKEKELDKLHMDLRLQTFTGDDGGGGVGLKDVLGRILVPAEFDSMPERYDYFDIPYLIPVIKDRLYYLYNRKEDKIVSKGYERIFRYVWSYMDYFVAVNGSKKGVLDSLTGQEVVPIDMDEIYESPDFDSFIPLLKDCKVGACCGNIFVKPVYDKMEICSEDYTKVWINGIQGWLDYKGQFTQNEEEASFWSYYDYSK